MSAFNDLPPRVDKIILIIIAGLMWCGVGIMLVSVAVAWIRRFDGEKEYLFYAAGILTAIPVHLFGFSKIAGRNINRLLPVTQKKSIFSFITVKSYFTIVIMVALGITLRHSTIPRQYLSVIYNAIGLALFLSGLGYFRRALKLYTVKRTQLNNLNKLK